MRNYILAIEGRQIAAFPAENAKAAKKFLFGKGGLPKQLLLDLLTLTDRKSGRPLWSGEFSDLTLHSVPSGKAHFFPANTYGRRHYEDETTVRVLVPFCDPNNVNDVFDIVLDLGGGRTVRMGDATRNDLQAAIAVKEANIKALQQQM